MKTSQPTAVEANVHTGPRAGAVARSWKARAVTIGPDVYSRSPLPPPILRHELAHVAQYFQGRTGPEGALVASTRSDPLEQEAATGALGSARSPATVFRWDNPDDEHERPGPEELAHAVGRRFLRESGIAYGPEGIRHVLAANRTGGTLRRLRTTYDQDYEGRFFADLDRVLTGDGWGRILPVVESVLTISEKIQTHTWASTDEEGIYRLLRRIPPPVARRLLETQFGAEALEGEESFATVDAALRDALTGLWQDVNEYHRARAILVDRAGLAPERPSDDAGAERVATARQDAVYDRIHAAFERYGFWGQTPLVSQALLAAAELSRSDRSAVLARVQRHAIGWGLADMTGYQALVRVLQAGSDAEALRYAMSVAIREDEDDVDELGMERAMLRAAQLLQEASSDPAELARVRRSLNDDVLVTRLVTLPGWRARLQQLQVPDDERIGLEITHAEDTASLVDRLATFGPTSVSTALQGNPALRRQLSSVEGSASEREAIDTLAAQTCTVLAEDEATPVARLAAWQMLRAARREDRAMIIAILRQLPPNDRATLPHSQSYRDLLSVMRRGSMMNAAFATHLPNVVSGEMEPHRLGWTFGHSLDLHDLTDVGEIEDVNAFSEALAGDYGGSQASMRQALVDFRQPPATWLSLPPARARAVQEYALRRELIHRQGDEHETRLNDVMFGDPRLIGLAENPVDPAMEAEFMRARLLDRAEVRASTSLLNDWSRSALDDATVRFMDRYDEIRLGGVTQTELAELFRLYRAAMHATTEHRVASDEAAALMASVVGAAVGVAVIIASGGTATPAVAALAGTLGGGAAAGVGYSLRAESTAATIATDFGAGFVEGSLAVALEPLLAGSALVRGAGSLGARGAGRLGASAVGRTAAGRGTARLVTSVIEGALSGSASEVYMTASQTATWNGSITEVFARLIAALGRGALMGAAGGAIGFGVMGGAGAAWRQVSRRYGQAAVREVLGALDAVALASREQLEQFGEEQIEALMRARRHVLLGDEASAADILRTQGMVPAGRVDDLIEALTARRQAAVSAALEMGRMIDHPRLAAELGLPPSHVVVDPSLPEGAVHLRYTAGLDGVSQLRLHVSRTASMGDALAHGPTARALRQWTRETRGVRGMLQRVRAWARGGTLSNADEVVLELQKHARMIEARQHALMGMPSGSRAAQRLEDEIAALREAGERLGGRLRGMGVPRGLIAGEGFERLDPISLEDMPANVRSRIRDSPTPHRASDWTSSMLDELPEGEYIYIVRQAPSGRVLKVGRTAHHEGSQAMRARMALYRDAAEVTGFDVRVELHRVSINTRSGQTAKQQSHALEGELRSGLYDDALPAAQRGFDWDREAAHLAGTRGPGTPTETPKGTMRVEVLEISGERVRIRDRDGVERWVTPHEDTMADIRARGVGSDDPAYAEIRQRNLYEWRDVDGEYRIMPVGIAGGTAPQVPFVRRMRNMTVAERRQELSAMMDRLLEDTPTLSARDLQREMGQEMRRSDRSVRNYLREAGLSARDYIAARRGAG